MTKKEDIILIGGGGHCRSCIDVIESENKFRIAGIVDVPQKMHERVLGHEIIACDEDLPRLVNEYPFFLITLGQIESAEKTKNMFEYIKQIGAKLAVVVSPLAYVSKTAAVGEGTIIMHKAFINANASVGKNCNINTGAIIEHDTKVSDHCHISTGSIVNGSCSIGQGVFVGSNSVLVNNIEVADNTVIGAGAVVTKSIYKSGTYAGNPAKKVAK